MIAARTMERKNTGVTAFEKMRTDRKYLLSLEAYIRDCEKEYYSLIEYAKNKRSGWVTKVTFERIQELNLNLYQARKRQISIFRRYQGDGNGDIVLYNTDILKTKQYHS